MRFHLGALQADPERQAAVEAMMESIVDALQEHGFTLGVLVARDEDGGTSIAGAGSAELVSDLKIADYLLEVGHDYKKTVE